jgi:hypothetical protein
MRKWLGFLPRCSPFSNSAGNAIARLTGVCSLAGAILYHSLLIDARNNIVRVRGQVARTIRASGISIARES